jgi:hypothetical protein
MPDTVLAIRTLIQKKNGVLGLFVPAAGGQAPQPYSMFRVCRGFIDDLNHLLPIRARITIEGRIAAGETSGEVQTPTNLVRWEVRPE